MIRQVRFRLPFLAIVFIASIWIVRAAYSETESNTACAPLPAGLVSWWPAEGNANDEVDVFNRGLSGSEIQAIYNAGGAGKCGSQGFTGVYIPFVVKPAKPPAKILQNGNFEAGPVDWGQLSSNGWQLILKASNLLVSPHSGNWAVWMGGDYDETAAIWQTVTIPRDAGRAFDSGL